MILDEFEAVFVFPIWKRETKSFSSVNLIKVTKTDSQGRAKVKKVNWFECCCRDCFDELLAEREFCFCTKNQNAPFLSVLNTHPIVCRP